jgi:NAD(P)-dependent dehydrogenase (short-subunit alcohol dehydrogenase family)
MSETISGPDGRPRCRWSLSAPEFLHYHDTEWGFAVDDVSRRLNGRQRTSTPVAVARLSMRSAAAASGIGDEAGDRVLFLLRQHPHLSVRHARLANAIVFIASDEASFITGHVLNVDGGKTH